MRAALVVLVAALGCGASVDGPTGELPGEGPDSGPSGPLTCSADGTQVVIGDEVVETCGPGSACTDGACVSACEAAAASGGAVGCSFRAALPRFYSGSSACFAVFLANSASAPADIEVRYGDTVLDPTTFARMPNSAGIDTWPTLSEPSIAPGEVAVLFLASSTSSYACPPGVTAATSTEAVPVAGGASSFSITTSQPVSAYDMNPFGGASSFLPSAELLLPTTAWGTGYVAVSPPLSNRGGGSSVRWGQVVAAENDTLVTLRPPIDLPAAGSAPAAPAGVATSFTMQRGEMVEWTAGTLTGMVVASDKPVAFVGGDTYICYNSATSNLGGCDSSHQMIPPIRALGSSYAVAPHPTRNGPTESIRYQLVGMVDGTQLSYSTAIPGAPATLDAGQEVLFESTVAFVVSSQDDDHPFHVAQTMAGCFANGGDCIGDEEVVGLLPAAQYLREYVFLTDPSYGTTRLTVVRARGESGSFADVTIDCVGAVTGWQPLGSDHEFTFVDLMRAGAPVGTCQNGRQAARSDAPFGLTVWGMDHAASYGYPAGGGFAEINSVVVPPVE